MTNRSIYDLRVLSNDRNTHNPQKTKNITSHCKERDDHTRLMYTNLYFVLNCDINNLTIMGKIGDNKHDFSL